MFGTAKPAALLGFSIVLSQFLLNRGLEYNTFTRTSRIFYKLALGTEVMRGGGRAAEQGWILPGRARAGCGPGRRLPGQV